MKNTKDCFRSLLFFDSMHTFGAPTAQSRGELERARLDAALAPAVVDTWPYRARNTLFYAPDAMGAEESNDGTAQVCMCGQRPPVRVAECSEWQREGEKVVAVDFCSI